jgi:hypothetical protein
MERSFWPDTLKTGREGSSKVALWMSMSLLPWLERVRVAWTRLPASAASVSESGDHWMSPCALERLPRLQPPRARASSAAGRRAIRLESHARSSMSPS